MSLEDEVNGKQSRRLIRKSLKLGWKLGMAAATTALSAWALSLLGASASLGIVVGAGFAGGGMLGNLARGKSLYNSLDAALTTYSAVNMVIPHMVWLGQATFPLIPNYDIAGKILRTAYAMTAYNAVFLSTFKGAGHLVDNYLNPKGIGETVKKNFWRDFALIGGLFGLFYGLDANNIAKIAMYHPWTGYFAAPTFAWGAPPVGFLHNYITGAKK